MNIKILRILIASVFVFGNLAAIGLVFVFTAKGGFKVEEQTMLFLIIMPMTVPNFVAAITYFFKPPAASDDVAGRPGRAFFALIGSILFPASLLALICAKAYSRLPFDSLLKSAAVLEACFGGIAAAILKSMFEHKTEPAS